MGGLVQLMYQKASEEGREDALGYVEIHYSVRSVLHFGRGPCPFLTGSQWIGDRAMDRERQWERQKGPHRHLYSLTV